MSRLRAVAETVFLTVATTVFVYVYVPVVLFRQWRSKRKEKK